VLEERPPFGQLLRKFRLTAGLSQEVLAERAALSTNGISALERGASLAPQRETLALLVKALRLSAEQQLALEQAAIRPSRPRDRHPVAAQPALNNNLPRTPSSFVGRESEIAAITALLENHQLVTVVGFGGVGKTRTCLQVAGRALAAFADGVWFVELAPLARGGYVASAVAHAVGVPVPTDGDRHEKLARTLQNKSALLLLDNCEHVIDCAAALVAAILRGCPNVKVLASSRQRLGIAAESIYRLPPLAVESATALFVDRARAIDQNFAATGENAMVIAQICRELDCSPLAIELAASRLGTLTPHQLHERLSERFRILTAGNRDALPRQQTLRALIDWSHDLLNEPERELFRVLGIFVNGFTIAGAVAVAGLGELDTLDLLGSLVDKSFVVAEPAGDARRYRLLESTRLYAREKLQNAGDWDECARRHLRYLRTVFFETGERYERTARINELSSVLATELEDVRAALDWAVVNDPLAGAELLAEIRPFWRSLGLHGEGAARIRTMLAALSEEQPCLRARLWSTLSFLAGEMVDATRQAEAAEQALAQARVCGDPAVLVEALMRSARSAANAAKFDQAAAALEEADSLGPTSEALRVQLLSVRAVVSMMAGDLAAASAGYERLRAEHRLLGNCSEDRANLVNVAEMEHARGETRRAIALLREILPDFKASRDRTILATALANCAGYLDAIDDPSGAAEMARDAIRELAIRTPQATDVAVSIEHLALASALSGDLPRAAILKGYADAELRELEFKREFTEMTTHERVARLLEERLQSGELAELIAKGARLIPEDAIAFALEEA
jgi:predicted ATPase/transcriptional regulator with XRE-family HTH domain